MQFIPVPASQYSANMRITLDRRYQDYILGLLLDKNLSGSQPGSDVRDVARARTLTALRRVGNNRKGDVLRFLRESGLIYKGKEIVDLREADLSDADLSNIKLSGVDLSNVKLSGANLSGADLSNANLNGANLKGPPILWNN